MTINDGWYFEGPDPSVGLFGDIVVHEECDLWDEEECQPAPVESSFTTTLSDDGKHVIIATTFTCACKATTTVTESEPKSWHELPACEENQSC